MILSFDELCRIFACRHVAKVERCLDQNADKFTRLGTDSNGRPIASLKSEDQVVTFPDFAEPVTIHGNSTVQVSPEGGIRLLRTSAEVEKNLFGNRYGYGNTGSPQKVPSNSSLK